jgi:tRNA threonylcarbamoyladenosine biosynthesis protein TsaE
LQGDLGSGKTTLVQSLCRLWNVTDLVTSPTFSLVNEYRSPKHGTICHMDLYRLEKMEDLAQIGIEEYLDSGHICLIEWPDIANEYYTMPCVRIKIKAENNNIRTFIITTDDTVDA